MPSVRIWRLFRIPRKATYDREQPITQAGPNSLSSSPMIKPAAFAGGGEILC